MYVWLLDLKSILGFLWVSALVFGSWQREEKRGVEMGAAVHLGVMKISFSLIVQTNTVSSCLSWFIVRPFCSLRKLFIISSLLVSSLINIHNCFSLSLSLPPCLPLLPLLPLLWWVHKSICTVASLSLSLSFSLSLSPLMSKFWFC